MKNLSILVLGIITILTSCNPITIKVYEDNKLLTHRDFNLKFY